MMKVVEEKTYIFLFQVDWRKGFVETRVAGCYARIVLPNACTSPLDDVFADR